MTRQIQDKDRFPVAMAYLGFLCGFPPFLAFFMLAKSDDAKFHAKQGAYLTTVMLGFLVLLQIIALVARLTMPTVTFLVPAIVGLMGLLFLAFILACGYCMAKAFRGERWELPVVGPLAAGR